MAAMVTTPDVPDARRHGRGHGCCGQTSCGGSGCGMECGSGCGSSCGGCGSGGCGSACGGGGCGGCGYGGYGMMSGCGGCGYGGMMAPMGAPVTAPAPQPGAAPGRPMPSPTTAAPTNAATLVVSGAQGATISVGGLVSTAGTDTRVLVSPTLEAGQAYHYDLTAEVVRDGQTVRLTQPVTVRPGETTEVRLDFAAGAVVMK
jgi:uncharacterized protein (TIGR03000 family)